MTGAFLKQGVLPDVLLTLVTLSMFVERGLALLFEHRLYLDYSDQRFLGWFKLRYLKEPIAFGVSLVLCEQWGFDAISALRGSSATALGFGLTAAIVAGGSKASIALFQNVLNVRSTAARERAEIRDEAKRARKDLDQALTALQPAARLATTPEEIERLQDYLVRFGYLTDASEARAAVDRLRKAGVVMPKGVTRGELDARTVAALVQAQKGAGLDTTGVLDAGTRGLLRSPRCPMLDFSPVAAVDPGRWPPQQRADLCYCHAGAPTAGLSAADARRAIDEAFAEWQRAGVGIRFREVQPHEPHHISVDWRPKDDPDFNMEAAIAHADFPPFPVGAATIVKAPPVPLHFDLSEDWSVDGDPFAYDLQSVALHEIGHCLGLRHSEGSESVMYASFLKGRQRRTLHFTDVDSLRTLYA